MGRAEDYIISIAPPNCDEPTKGLGETLFEGMKSHGESLAQISVDTGAEETFSSLLRRCVRTAIRLRERKIKNDDIVGMMSTNNLEFCVPFVAAQFNASPFISWDPTEPADRLALMFNEIPLKIIFVSPEYVEKIESALKMASRDIEIVVFGPTKIHTCFEQLTKEIDGEEDFKITPVEDLKRTACILYSSGTTGQPKGICLSHYCFVAQGDYVRHIENLDVDLLQKETPRVSFPLKILNFVAVHWISSYSSVVNSMRYGICIVVWSNFDISKLLKIIEEYKICLVLLPSAYVNTLLKHGRPENLNITCPLRITIAGSVIPGEQILKVRKLVPEADIYQGYGLTEVMGIATLFQALSKNHRKMFTDKPGSSGLPLCGYSYKIVDVETEEILGPNKQGEIRIKTKLIMNGLYNQDSSDCFDEDGFFKTGDIGYYDEDQCFFIVDRVKEVFKFRGYNVQPAVIENELLAHPAVKLTAVIPIPNDEDLFHPMGIVVLEEGCDVSAEELLKYVNPKLGDAYKLRAGIKIVSEMPMTATGKIKRRQLRDMILSS